MILTVTFIICMFIGMPILAVIGWACILSMAVGSALPMTFIPQNLYTGIDNFPLIAIIGFILAGSLMEPAGISEDIIHVAKKFVGHLRGGLACVTIMACMIFAAMSGSGPATTAAIGSIMIPGMIRAGYPKGFAAGVSASGGVLGILIPPSNPMIIYGVIANCSIAGLFVAGFVPGVLLTSMLLITAILVAFKRNLKGTEESFSLKELLWAIWKGKWALLTPVIILGGIYGGIFTPTEAAVVGVFYALFVGFLITKKLNFKTLIQALIRTSLIGGTVNVLIGVSVTFSRLLTIYQIPQIVGEFLSRISNDPFIILILIAGVLFCVGFIADTIAIIIVLAPIFLPITNKIGIDPIHLGIVFVVCSEAGFLTPPFGANLFVAMKLIDVTLEGVSKAVIPFIIAIILAIFLVCYFPQISLWLPSILMR
jgi:C4-dicarboxylate transporter DctM subunit